MRVQGPGPRIQRARRACGWVLMVCAGVCAGAQEIQFGGEQRAAAKKGHVAYVAEAVDVAAGKPAVVELRFRVDEGFHVNSHRPSSELLVPTVLKLDAASGVKVVDEEYPKGVPFRIEVGAGETLDVYQGEFRVKLRVVARKGESTLHGELRYQACDRAACYPPRTLAVVVMVTGK
jgi:DsbC/DsbD-like thiol-disulfide interchange protein